MRGTVNSNRILNRSDRFFPPLTEVLRPEGPFIPSTRAFAGVRAFRPIAQKFPHCCPPRRSPGSWSSVSSVGLIIPLRPSYPSLPLVGPFTPTNELMGPAGSIRWTVGPEDPPPFSPQAPKSPVGPYPVLAPPFRGCLSPDHRGRLPTCLLHPCAHSTRHPKVDFSRFDLHVFRPRPPSVSSLSP